MNNISEWRRRRKMSTFQRPSSVLCAATRNNRLPGPCPPPQRQFCPRATRHCAAPAHYERALSMHRYNQQWPLAYPRASIKLSFPLRSARSIDPPATDKFISLHFRDAPPKRVHSQLRPMSLMNDDSSASRICGEWGKGNIDRSCTVARR